MQTTDPNHSQHHHALGASPQSAVSAEKLPGIHHIIAVGSDNGCVGKSTASINLALALQQLGARVGFVDADILGPSISGMLRIPTGEPPAMTPDSKMIPAERHGLNVVSMGMLTGDDKPAVLRGSMVGKHLKIFVDDCQGCASSQVTLRQGFEVMLKRVTPETEEIVDTTNHAAGKQSFYPRHEVPL